MKRNKIYERRPPTKDSKLFFIFCEGEKRETTYFYFFNRIASQVIVQIVPLEDGKNSPLGLFQNAKNKLIKGPDNPNPVYDLNKGDEVWFVIDTDKWGRQIVDLRNAVAAFEDWHIAQSNPSFEIWLYYHFIKTKPKEKIENFKNHLNQIIEGGFDNRKHPVFLKDAIKNASANFAMENDFPDYGSTAVFKLGRKILPLVELDIDLLLKNIKLK